MPCVPRRERVRLAYGVRVADSPVRAVDDDLGSSHASCDVLRPLFDDALSGSTHHGRRTPFPHCLPLAVIGNDVEPVIHDASPFRSCLSSDPSTGYLFPRRDGVCESALPAAVFEARPVRPSRRVLLAAFAAFPDVTLLELPFLPISPPPLLFAINGGSADVYAVTVMLPQLLFAVNRTATMGSAYDRRNLMAVLGDRIRGERQRRGWTLREFSAKTGLSVPYLSDIERKREVNPTIDSLKMIAQALGCSLGDLVGEGTLRETGTWQAPLSPSLQRFVSSKDFTVGLERVATRVGRPAETLRPELVNFLASAPKRSKGELTPEDWKRLLNLYTFIIDEP